MFYKVPIIDGLMDIDYNFLDSGISLSNEQAVVKLREGYEVRESWDEITQEEFESYRPQKEEPTPRQTLEEKIDQLQQDNLVLMLGITELYEKLSGGGE